MQLLHRHKIWYPMRRKKLPYMRICGARGVKPCYHCKNFVFKTLSYDMVFIISLFIHRSVCHVKRSSTNGLHHFHLLRKNYLTGTRRRDNILTQTKGTRKRKQHTHESTTKERDTHMKWMREEIAQEMKCPYALRNCEVCQCIAWENKGDYLIESGCTNTEEIRTANEYGRCTVTGKV